MQIVNVRSGSWLRENAQEKVCAEHSQAGSHLGWAFDRCSGRVKDSGERYAAGEVQLAFAGS